MTKSGVRKDSDDSDVLFDSADVRDASAFESQNGRREGAGSFLRIVRRVVRRKRFMLAISLFGLMFVLFAFRQHGYLAPDVILSFLNAHPVITPVIFNT